MDFTLSFNAGPSAQVGFGVALGTAYHLALGAYGWFKAKERSKSLKDVLKVSGATLVPSKSFNIHHYATVLSCQVQGVFVHGGQMLRAALPKMSSAASSDPSLSCLRALVTSLLCFYDTDACTAILTASIPSTLIEVDDPAEFEFEAHTAAVLREFVESVAVEEDNNLLRQHILNFVANCRSSLTGANEADIQACEPVHSSDMRLTVGLVKWILLPVAQRPSLHYPTRSLRVWTVASAMQFLGFEVSPLSQAISSQSAYDFFSNDPLKPQTFATVFLVTSQCGTTDPLQGFGIRLAGYAGLRPQIMPVRAIPWSAFRHLAGSDRKVNTQYLADVWKFAFKEARASVSPPSFNSFGFVRMNLTNNAEEAVFELHRSLLRLYSPEFARFCGKSMRMFTPGSTNSPGWDPDAMQTWLEALAENRPSGQPVDIELADNSLIVAAIILGTVYGAVSRCCYSGGQEMNEDTEVVFRPDLLFEHDRLKGWAAAVGRVIGGVILYQDWNGCVYEAVLGADFGMFHGVNLAAGRQYSKPLKRESLAHGRLFLGGQSNGMAAITSMAIEPSIRPESLVRLVLSPGQILNLPLVNGDFIEAADWQEPWTSLPPESLRSVGDLGAEGWNWPDNLTRADLEPCWEEDPRRVVIRIRRKGNVVGTANVNGVMHKLTANYIPCHCRSPSHDTDDWKHDGWEAVLAEVLMDNRSRWSASSVRSLVVQGCEEEKKVLLDARRGSAMALYGIGIANTTHATMNSSCFVCAGKHVEENPHKTFVILSMLGSEPLLSSPSSARGGAATNIFEESRVMDASYT